MTASAPGAIVTTAILPNDITDDTDSKTGTPRTGTVGALAGWLNRAHEEIIAIETENGVDWAGTFTNLKARLDALQTCRKLTDLALTGTTLTNVTDLALVFAANSSYDFEFHIPHAAGTARGIGLGLTLGGTITTLAAGVTIYGVSGDGTASAWHGVINSSGDSVITAAAASTGKSMAVIFGTAVMGGTGGTLQLQGRQGSGATAANATIYTGAFGRAYLN